MFHGIKKECIVNDKKLKKQYNKIMKKEKQE